MKTGFKHSGLAVDAVLGLSATPRIQGASVARDLSHKNNIKKCRSGLGTLFYPAIPSIQGASVWCRGIRGAIVSGTRIQGASMGGAGLRQLRGCLDSIQLDLAGVQPVLIQGWGVQEKKGKKKDCASQEAWLVALRKGSQTCKLARVSENPRAGDA
eukprot:scaffold36241_cov18-Tisochrysis_lutea.AAC.1